MPGWTSVKTQKFEKKSRHWWTSLQQNIPENSVYHLDTKCCLLLATWSTAIGATGEDRRISVGSHTFSTQIVYAPWFSLRIDTSDHCIICLQCQYTTCRSYFLICRHYKTPSPGQQMSAELTKSWTISTLVHCKYSARTTVSLSTFVSYWRCAIWCDTIACSLGG